MESLENKLNRLSPELRKEVEDYVDYLVSRSENHFMPRDAVVPMPPVSNGIPPALRAPEPAPVSVTPGISVVGNGGQNRREEESPSRVPASQEPEEEIIHEIMVGGGDPVTRDYLDYGQFETTAPPLPSPATEAVQRVKAKLGGKKDTAAGTHLLEWID